MIPDILAFCAIAFAILIVITVWAVIANAVAAAVDRRIEALSDDHEMIKGNPQ